MTLALRRFIRRWIRGRLSWRRVRKPAEIAAFDGPIAAARMKHAQVRPLEQARQKVRHQSDGQGTGEGSAMAMIDFARPGRMISGSKTSPKGHVCVFNANLCAKSKGKLWFGDLDVTADVSELVRFAKETGEALYVLKERDARFSNEASPKYENAVAIVRPNGTIEFCEDFV